MVNVIKVNRWEGVVTKESRLGVVTWSKRETDCCLVELLVGSFD